MSAARTARAPTPIWGLVEESLDEAEFLWRRWEHTLSTHDRDLEGLWFWVEDRLLGSLDGVRAGGDAAVETLLVPAMESDDTYRATAAAHVLALEGRAPALDALTAAVRGAADERLPLFRRALELAPSDVLLARLEREFVDAGAGHRALLLAVRTFQQQTPGAAVADALSSRDPLLEAEGLRALRHGQPSIGLGEVNRQLDAEDPGVTQAAMETGLILGAPAAWMRCQQLAAAQKPGCGPALLALALLGTEHDQGALFQALGNEPVRKQALFALGFAGTQNAMEAALEVMKQPPLARLAGEAFCAMTGLDLEAEKLIATEPEPEEPIPFEQENLDADLVPTADDLLPLPDVAGVHRWWAQNQRRFPRGQRYLAGEPVRVQRLQDALLKGPTRRRHAIAFELAVRTAGAYQVETRAFTRTQKQQLRTFDHLMATEMPRNPLARAFSPV